MPRPRLHQLLTEGRQHPITLISAGPGCGKTLTVASWARGAGRPDRLAWLSLDDTDNDLREFWADVVGALAISGAVPPGSAILDLSPSVGFGIQEARLGCAALATLPATVTLVLDDLHRITDPVVLRSLGELLEHQPPQLRLVLATRFDPPLRLHRLRLNGDVLDVHSSDLAFTETEAGALFAVQGVDLSPDELTGVWQRTQGWAAGLRLALMSLNSTDVQAGVSKFTGSTPLVAEYLIEEVLDQLPDVDRHFLLAASTVDRICASLATELTGRPDSQLILEGLAAKHALVVGLAGRNDWFRLHPLLQEMLQHRLALERPELVVELHARASRWFETQGEPVAAIRHACLAGHWDEVGRLAAQAVPLLVTARAGAFVAALEPAVARAAATPTTSCLLASAMTHYHRHDYESMARDVRDAAELLPGLAEDYREPARVVIATLRLVHARADDPVRVAPTAQRRRLDAAVARLDRLERPDMTLPALLRGWVAATRADSLLAAHQPDAALALIGDAPEVGGYQAALARVTMAKAHLMLNRPEDALQVLEPVTVTAVPYRAPVVQARVLAALAADRLHRDTAAMAAMSDAVDVAHGVGITRPFRAGGPRVEALLTRHRHTVGRHLEFTAPLCGRGAQSQGATATTKMLVEPLTERELAVLRYLPTMFKAAEIAADLFVTVNTVKSHQQSIYRKLEVSTRRGAVDRARELELL